MSSARGSSANAPTGLLGLDRKQMEAERLARMAKKRSAPSEEGATNVQQAQSKRVKAVVPTQTSSLTKDDDELVVVDVKSQAPSARSKRINVVEIEDIPHDSRPKGVVAPGRHAPGRSRSPSAFAQQASQSSQVQSGTADLQFPHGVIKKTWAYGHARHNDIKIEEVLQKNSLNVAIISSWQWDFDWLMTKFVPGKTRYIFAMEAKSEDEQNSWREQFAGLQSVRLVFPTLSKSKYSRMHSKLMLLYHPTHLRIVVSSANPTRHDWGESGLLENSVFLIDLPRLSSLDATASDKPPMTAFANSLLTFLTAQGFPPDVLNSIPNFDFSKTANISFIHSIAGNYTGDEAGMSTGLPSLALEVQRLGLATSKEERLEVDFATSSLGTLDEGQVSMFSEALRGNDPWPAAEPHISLDDEHETAFRIIFPSKRTVKHSKGGPDAAGTIFLPSHSFEKPTFPRQLLHDYRSTRSGLLSHNKFILVRNQTTVFVYMGSANLSASAWGRLSAVKKGRGKEKKEERKLVVGNWECGVLMPVLKPDEVGEEGKKVMKQEGEPEVADVKLFEMNGLSVPWSIPPRRYEAEDEGPWVQDMKSR